MTPKANSRNIRSEINITPLVDVMLVILIIFMVTAPMMIQGVDINLPETEAKEIKTREDPLIITVNRDGAVSIEKHAIEISELAEKLKSIFSNRKDGEILLRADEDVPYGFVVKVMAAVKGAGIEKLGMITEPEKR
jgi:biopolymer transport protein TolR